MALPKWRRELSSARKLMISKLEGNRFKVVGGKSKTGRCAECIKMQGSHNVAGGKVPPYHPNCKCSAH